MRPAIRAAVQVVLHVVAFGAATAAAYGWGGWPLAAATAAILLVVLAWLVERPPPGGSTPGGGR